MRQSTHAEAAAKRDRVHELCDDIAPPLSNVAMVLANLGIYYLQDRQFDDVKRVLQKAFERGVYSRGMQIMNRQLMVRE